MRLYTAHRRDAGLFEEAELVLVKDGFCWPAFFFTFLWALFHRMWMVAILILVAELLLGALAESLGVGKASSVVLSLATMLVIGWSGNDWRRRSLLRRGYDEGQPVVAENVGAAEYRYLASAAAR